MLLLRLTAIDFSSQFQTHACETNALQKSSDKWSQKTSQASTEPLLRSGDTSLDLEQQTGGEIAMKADEMRPMEGKSQDFSYLHHL